MLLKYPNSSERSTTFNGKGKAAKVTSRIHRKTLRIATKPGKKAPGKKISFGKHQKNLQASKNFPPSTTSLCDNSNDSGLGFEESHHHHQTMALSTSSSNSPIYYRPLSALRHSDVALTPSTTVVVTPAEDVRKPIPSGKKVKGVMKPAASITVNQNQTLRTENEDTCNSDDFSSFYQASTSDSKSKMGSSSPSDSYCGSSLEKLSLSSGSEGSSPTTSDSASPKSDNFEALLTSSLHKQFSNISRDGTVQLQIITQPEQQHRARYQTEGSRGAVKDRSGNGFPVVRLNGTNKPTTLQVFIGNDVGRVSPHIFYQACKVSGKNSTPCGEIKTEGTMVIEIELKPENEMTVTCDCVGILKERNVDVEHRLGRNHSLAAAVTRNKKKSTKCRIVFRARINEDSAFPEYLQVCSNTITCTQPPGVPEICKKSIESCSVIGGKELFIIGKNFLKDTKVTFVQFDESRQPKKIWEETVQPDKEFLQQTHLICVVPPFPNGDSAIEPIQVQIYVTSSNKKSEAHNFAYMPIKKPRPAPPAPVAVDQPCLLFTNHQDANVVARQQQQMVPNVLSITWNESQVGASPDSMMLPPIMPRKPSFSDTSTSEAPITLKTEFIDQTQHSGIINGEAQQDLPTSSTAGLQTSIPVSVKKILFDDSAMIGVRGMQNPFGNQESLMTSSRSMFDGFKIQTDAGSIELQHIKTEQQNPEQCATSPISMMPPPPPQQELNPAQQQQAVENFLNLIVMTEPNMVTSQSQNHHHLTQDIILNSPSTVATDSNVMQPEQLGNSTPTSMMMTNTIAPMMCEPSLMSVQMVHNGMNAMVQDGINVMVQDQMNTMVPSIEETAASSIVSTAVSDATAETQAVVKQMIAQVAAEMLSENASQTQSTINNFISNTLGTNMMTTTADQQQQITTNSQQLQDMLVHELNEATSNLMQEATKKEETQHAQATSLINAAPTSAPSTTITQPFSPNTQDVTAMSESDLISFINPSVFM